ncbi:MAG: DUF1963 domain-containing protein [Muribaculaceae bacterium]|nr:DUF1963 domain-containing protein [Muribaculaceae bacterium]
MCLGDEGAIGFYIKRSDLLRRDFSHIWFGLQCC